ncbi:hypothetical protein C1H46_010576 [Malus baccata]|uniref:Cyclic nucleotide-binding domain-containing protein n=1 Tax=Malus baccata TaxID=106549 RepID=A0A540MYC6_MALBA|nr:hypothetical protein C1H46_010576 [Malus baccata]
MWLSENLIFIPETAKDNVKSQIMRKVPQLQSMDEKVLKAICKHFKPLRYAANNIIIHENEPLGMVFLIMEGVVKIESGSNDVSATSLEAGNIWGEELLDWVTIARQKEV